MELIAYIGVLKQVNFKDCVCVYKKGEYGELWKGYIHSSQIYKYLENKQVITSYIGERDELIILIEK